jgi:TPR repeat protein
VQQWKSDGDTARARAELEKRIAARPADTAAHYTLGCLFTAENDLSSAVKHFVEAQRTKPDVAMSRQIQRQLRRLCSMWFHLAENEDPQVTNPPAMTALGAAYEHGWGVGIDVQEAKRWYRNAANAGDAAAMCRIASIYEHKTGATVETPQSDEWYRAQALEWYRKAAALGNAEAKQWLTTNDR